MVDGLPKVKLSRATIDFEQDCIDPVAKIIVVEALMYAIEKANSRLASIGKIFTTVEDSGIKTLAIVNAIKEQINTYPSCKLSTPPLAESFSLAPLPEKVTRQSIEKAVRQAEQLAAPAQVSTVTPPEKAVPGPRTRPARWNVVAEVLTTEGIKKFDNPGAAATALGIDTYQANTQVQGFTRAGLSVSGDLESSVPGVFECKGTPIKGVGRFVITMPTCKPIPFVKGKFLVAIPAKYQLQAKSIESAEDKEAKVEKAAKPKEMRLYPVKTMVEGKKDPIVIGYDVVNPDHPELVIEGSRMTVVEGEALLATKQARL